MRYTRLIITLVFFVLLFLNNQAGLCQQSDTSLFLIKYRMKYMCDTTMRDSQSVTYYLLKVNDTKSQYIPWYHYVAYLDFEKYFPIPPELANQVIIKPTILMFVQATGSLNFEYITRIPKQKKMAYLAYLSIKDFYTQTPLPDIKWALKKGSKRIMNQECSKAVGSYKGREYTVWYAPGLPFSYGPWKLGGLPGIILQAEDARHEVLFEAVDIFNPPFTEAGTIHNDEKFQRIISLKEYEKQKYLYEKDIVEYMNSFIDTEPKYRIYFYDNVNDKMLDVRKLSPEMKHKARHPYLFRTNPLELTDR